MTTRPGSALRFLALVMGGWLVARGGFLLMPVAWPVADRDHPAVAAQAERHRPVRQAVAVNQSVSLLSSGSLERSERIGSGSGRLALLSVGHPLGEDVPRAMGHAQDVLDEEQDHRAAAMDIGRGAMSGLRDHPKSRSRWSMTGWALWRPDIAGSLATEPLLGGSQAGLRIDYRLWSDGERMIGLYGRFARAFERPFAEEAALGLSARPFARLPLSLLVERRQALGRGARSAFALMAVGGIGPTRLGPGKLANRFDMEAYAQAGWVGSSDPDGFADGRLALGYRLIDKGPGRPGLLLGIAASAGAQRGASRLDIGPELRLTLPVANGHVRLTAEWRQRIAGDAKPVSGPAMSLIADF